MAMSRSRIGNFIIRSARGWERVQTRQAHDYDAHDFEDFPTHQVKPRRVFGANVGGSRPSYQPSYQRNRAYPDHPNQQSNWGQGNRHGGGLVKPGDDRDEQIPMVTDFYTPKPSTATQEELDEFIKTHNVSMEGEGTDQFQPLLRLQELDIPENMRSGLAGFKDPTPIQSLCWPAALAGRNLVGIAQTGSGKTLGYLLPGLVHALAQPGGLGEPDPRILVICPTRELAQQVATVARTFGRAMGLRSQVVFGGANRGPQAQMLRQGLDVIVGTPGRLLDFLTTGDVRLTRASYVVLDEADRMLDMGFEPQIRQILKYARQDRQTLMFSATWPQEVRHLAADFIGSNPMMVNIGSRELTANPNISQEFVFLGWQDKMEKLGEILEGVDKKEKVIIFSETKRNVDYLVKQLYQQRNRFGSVLGLHGDKSQATRDATLDRFRSGECRLLVATDVASRGLDVADVSLVLNYDFPNDIHNYVHRIGRTARAFAHGRAVAFLTDNDGPRATELISVLEEAGQEVPEELIEFAQRTRHIKQRPRMPPRPRSYSPQFRQREDHRHYGSQRHRHHSHGGDHYGAQRHGSHGDHYGRQRRNPWGDDDF